MSNGILNWFGSRTISAESYIEISGGTLNFGTSETALTLSISGKMIIRKSGGTFAQTYCTATRTSSTAQIAMMSNTTDHIVVGGPTLPAAGDVDSTADDYGYADALISGTLDAPTAEEIAAAMWSDETSPSRTLTS
jgi:hypothetical protein